MVSLRAAEVTISHKKSHQRRFCRDQEYLRLRALNRAKRTLPARDSSRNACCLLPLRGVKTAASTRGIIHRREISSASNRDESSCGSGEERARHPSRFWFSAPSFPSVPQPLDLGYVLRQERSSGHQWRETVKESACHQLDQFETLYEETCALKQPRTLAGTSASSPESPCINPLLSLSLSLSLPLSLVLFQNTADRKLTWPAGEDSRFCTANLRCKNVANWPSRQREYRRASGRASLGIRPILPR